MQPRGCSRRQASANFTVTRSFVHASVHAYPRNSRTAGYSCTAVHCQWSALHPTALHSLVLLQSTLRRPVHSTQLHSPPLRSGHSPLHSFLLHSDLATLHSSPFSSTRFHSPRLRSGHSPLQSFQLHSIPFSSTPIWPLSTPVLSAPLHCTLIHSDLDTLHSGQSFQLHSIPLSSTPIWPFHSPPL